jgi:hypothetical protein
MHTYRKSGKGDDTVWTVGYWLNDANERQWFPLRDYAYEHFAMMAVSFLNGGVWNSSIWDNAEIFNGADVGSTGEKHGRID